MFGFCSRRDLRGFVLSSLLYRRLHHLSNDSPCFIACIACKPIPTGTNGLFNQSLGLRILRYQVYIEILLVVDVCPSCFNRLRWNAIRCIALVPYASGSVSAFNMGSRTKQLRLLRSDLVSTHCTLHWSIDLGHIFPSSFGGGWNMW